MSEKETKQKKPIYKKWWFWAIVIIIIIAIATQGGGSNNSQPASANSNKAQTKEIYALKEEATLDGANITVTKVEKSNGSEWDKPKAGNEYVIVTVQIKNTSAKNISYNPYDYKLQDGNGSIESITFTTIDSDTSLTSGELAPNGTKTGTITFEAPKGDMNLTLIYEGNFWTGSQLKFNLQ